MSEELNEGNAGRGVAGHNVENRKQILNNSLKRMWTIDKEIADLTEQHLKDLREEKSAIVKRVREDLNMPAPVFKARYASYKLEAKAIELEDNATIDAIREMNEMAPVGSQIDMLEAVKGFEDKKPAAAAAAPEPEDDDDGEEEEGEEEEGEEALADLEGAQPAGSA